MYQRFKALQYTQSVKWSPVKVEHNDDEQELERQRLWALLGLHHPHSFQCVSERQISFQTQSDVGLLCGQVLQGDRLQEQLLCRLIPEIERGCMMWCCRDMFLKNIDAEIPRKPAIGQ